MQPLFVIARAALDALDHPAVAGRQHPVAQTGDLGEIAGGNERTSAFAGEAPDQRMNLSLGTDIDALCRLVEQQHADLAGQPLGENNLLLVAAGQRRRRKRSIAWTKSTAPL